MRFQIGKYLFAYGEEYNYIFTAPNVWECVKSFGPLSLYRNVSYKVYWQNKQCGDVVGPEAVVRLTKVTSWLN